MKVLLVGNYEFDGSTSMQIWANALYRELGQLGVDVQLISPRPFFGKMRRSANGIGKWFGYIDRFILFPRLLRAAAAKADVVHLCDHGSAMYTSHVNGKPVVVTCNDMLAVRGAMGELPEMRASLFGRFLQRWICQGLRRASRVACISQATFSDARRILNSDWNLCVILDGLNYPFQAIPSQELTRRLSAVPGIRAPYVLHVGSSHARKNRDGVLQTFALAAKGMDLQLVFAGEALTPGLDSLADRLGIRDRVVQVVSPKVEVIEALYNGAVALLFPSRYEGFGWPPIEAQACGCPVVGSDIAPIAEVIGQSGILKPLDDEEGMAAAIRRLASDPEYREDLRQRGFENIHLRFQTARMMDEYVALYRELAHLYQPQS